MDPVSQFLAGSWLNFPPPSTPEHTPRRRTKFKNSMSNHIRSADYTWMILNQMPNFQRFFRGYLDILKSNLQQVSVMGNDGNERYRYYTCGQEHDRRNPAWKPFQHLMRYCEKERYDFYEAKDMIEEQIGRKLICECQLLNDDKEIRRRDLERTFGVDFGEPGIRDMEVL